MTDRPTPHRSADRRRPRLSRTVLGLAVAALLAAWLPFSILYVNALTKQAVAAATAGARTVHVAGGHSTPLATPVITRTSGLP